MLGAAAAASRSMQRVASISYILDTMGLTVRNAYSLRKLYGGYSGASIRVRRSSDSAELDIGFIGEDLNIAAMLAHCGAGDGFVVSRYDQTGNGFTETNASATAQPQIVASGAFLELTGGKPGIRADGSNDILIATTASQAQPHTRCSVLRFNSIASGGNIYSDGANNSLNFSASGSLAMYGGSANQNIKTGIVANDTATVVETFNGASSTGRYNGASTSISPGTLSRNRSTFGGSYNGSTASGYCNVTASETITFISALSPTNAAIWEANAKAYWGTP